MVRIQPFGFTEYLLYILDTLSLKNKDVFMFDVMRSGFNFQ